MRHQIIARAVTLKILFLACGSAHGFGIFDNKNKQSAINEQLDQISSSVVDQSLGFEVNLAIAGQGESKQPDNDPSSKMYLQGLRLDFSNAGPVEANEGYTSSRTLIVQQNPFYTTLEGRQSVDVGTQARWNLSWKVGSPCGQLVCAFDVPEGVCVSAPEKNLCAFQNSYVLIHSPLSSCLFSRSNATRPPFPQDAST